MLEAEDWERIRRMMDERFRDYNSSNGGKVTELDTNAKIAAVAFLDFRKDMTQGFEGMNKRLDILNGTTRAHSQDILNLKLWRAFLSGGLAVVLLLATFVATSVAIADKIIK